MAISNELSSDIAAALIAASAKQAPAQLHELKEILIEVHSTLQQMTEQSRTARSFSLAAAPENASSDDAEAPGPRRIINRREFDSD